MQRAALGEDFDSGSLSDLVELDVRDVVVDERLDASGADVDIEPDRPDRLGLLSPRFKYLLPVHGQPFSFREPGGGDMLSITGEWNTITAEARRRKDWTMQDISRLVAYTWKAVELALVENPGIRTIFADPDEMTNLVVSGEFRRQASERRHGCPVPRFCIFSVTWECNLDCKGCCAGNYTPGSEMSLETIERVVREAIDLGSYIFIIVGGEPLMVPGLIETLGSLKGGVFALFTNGTLMNESHAATLGEAPNVFPIFSTEGTDEYTDSRRGAGVGKKVRDAMALLKSRDIAFGISAMVTPGNLSEVTSRQWFDHIWDLGVRFAFLIDYVPCGVRSEESLTLSDRDMTRKRAAIDARWAECRPMVVDFPFDEYGDDASCQAAGAGMIHINADGYVEPCPFSHYAVDNVREKPLAEIFGGAFLSSIRNNICTLPNPSGSCLLSQYAPEVAALAAEMGGFCTEGKPSTPA